MLNPSLYRAFVVTAFITHVWTVIIAFTEGGLLAGLISLFLPYLAEIYWMIQMFGENDTYSLIALVHLILAIPYTVSRRKRRK